MTAVVAWHCGVLPFGWTGVWLFFVISGYVVTLTVLQRFDRQADGGGLPAFFRRRTLRIVPVYYLYLCLGLVFVLVTGGHLEPITVAALFGFVNNYAMHLGYQSLAGWPVNHLWTIAVEVQFYLLFGFVLFRLPRPAVIAFLLAALMLSPMLRLATSAVLGGRGWDNLTIASTIYAGPFLHVDSFAVGALLAYASHAGILGRIARTLAVAGGLVFAVYVISYCYIDFAVGGARDAEVVRNVVSGVLRGQGREAFVYIALNAAFGGVVALAATRDRWIDWLLRPRPLQRIGETSYGAYVYHAVAILVARALVAPLIGEIPDEPTLAVRLAVFLVAYALTLAAAEASFRYFESHVSDRAWRSWVRRFGRREAPAATSARRL